MRTTSLAALVLAAVLGTTVGCADSGGGKQNAEAELTASSSWLVYWQSGDNLDGTSDTEYDVLFVVSSDDGDTWSDPAAINSTAGSDSGDDTSPSVAGDGSGTWIAVWQSTENLGGTGTDSDIFYAVSTDDGASWGTATSLKSTATSDGSSFDFGPAIATDQAGTWVVLWLTSENIGGSGASDRDVVATVSTDDGDSWSAPVLVNGYGTGDSSNETNPRLAADGDGNWVAIWNSGHDLGSIGTDTDILRATSSDGTTWSAAAAVNSDAGTDTSSTENASDLITDGAGTWLAVWRDNPDSGDAEVEYARSTNNGSTWSTVATLNSNAAGDTGTDSAIHAATDGAGNWLAVWESDADISNGTDVDAYVADSATGASWGTLAALNTTHDTDAVGYNDRAPDLATDGAGTWIAAWALDTNSGGFAEDVMFAISTNDGGSWTAPASLRGPDNAGEDLGVRIERAP